MPRPTRTIGPLHFEDLEPHRFEDLVRQLVYDFKQWRSLEATGRTGLDEGMDIRGIEIVPSTDIDSEVEDADEDQATPIGGLAPGRVWVIQCKRERNLGPGRVRTIVSDNLSSIREPVHGYVLVAACDFSRASRDAFREVCSSHGLLECYIWGKAEIEDQLFQSKNDHLLFAYFGISLQMRRRSIRSDLRTRLALKRQLTRGLGEIGGPHLHASVLIRDPRDERYPYIESPDEFTRAPAWRYWEFHGHEPPDHLAFVCCKYYAYVDWETKEYDLFDDHDAGIPHYPEVAFLGQDWPDPEGIGWKQRQYWWNKIPSEHRGWAITLRVIPYEWILAFDEIGDCYNEGPHLLVEYALNGDPFEPNTSHIALWPDSGNAVDPIPMDQARRISILPRSLDELTSQIEDSQTKPGDPTTQA